MHTLHKNCHDRIDRLAQNQIFHVCEESYPGIQVVNKNTSPMCIKCKRKGIDHRFSTDNHMNPRRRPKVLTELTQAEEMLIARASLILQVMHSIGGEYKYRGHTISFPQEVANLIMRFP